jgi:heme exporter protein D
MITSSAQWLYIAAAYGLAALVIAGLLIWVVRDGRRHAATLRDLEARGVRRRSSEGR